MQIKYDIFQDVSNNFVAGLLVLLAIALGKFFSKVPKKYIERYREKKYLGELATAQEKNEIMNHLADRSGGVHILITRYHNGGPQKATVYWEESGKICEGCDDKCDLYKKSNLLAHKWDGEPIDNHWINVVKRSINLKGKINNILESDLSTMGKKIWVQENIHSYKELFLKFKHNGIFCLGITFCKRNKMKAGTDAMIFQSANRLRKLL